METVANNFVWAQQGSEAAVMEMLDLYGPLAVLS